MARGEGWRIASFVFALIFFAFWITALVYLCEGWAGSGADNFDTATAVSLVGLGAGMIAGFFYMIYLGKDYMAASASVTSGSPQ